MRARHPSALAALSCLGLLAACAPNGTYQGKLTDARTGKARANERMVAHAVSGTDPTCQSMEATTGADGTFTIEATCPEHSYQVKPADNTLALDGDAKFDGGEQSTKVAELKAWRVPTSDGVFLVNDDNPTELKTAADTYWEPVFDSTQPDGYSKARYPSTIPNDIPHVSDNGYLAIAGQDNVEEFQVLPLVSHPGKIDFPNKDGVTASISDASWVGMDFKGAKVSGPADVTLVPSPIDSSKVKDLGGKNWKTRLVPPSALPAGTYAILGEKSSRMYIVSFGAAAPPAAETQTASAH